MGKVEWDQGGTTPQTKTRSSRCLATICGPKMDWEGGIAGNIQGGK